MTVRDENEMYQCEECGAEVPGEETVRRAGTKVFFCSSGCSQDYWGSN